MATATYIYWQDGDKWLGYLQEFPDYWTQGESHEDLLEHLRDLYKDLEGGLIPNTRHVGQLQIA